MIGQLFTKFGPNLNGIVTTPFNGPDPNGGDCGGNAVALQRNGMIVVVGDRFQQPWTSCFVLARYDRLGNLDPNFGTLGDGTVWTDLGGAADLSNDSHANAVLVERNGRIVVAGRANVGGMGTHWFNFALARYLPDGTLDASFGSDQNGMVVTNIGASGMSEITGVALQTDGKIVAAGYWSDFPGTLPLFALARYNPDGTLDDTFGVGGIVLTAFPRYKMGHWARANAVTIQRNGRIVVAGTTYVGPGISAFAIVGYSPQDGSVDAGFGNNGANVTVFPNLSADGLALALKSPSSPKSRLALAGAAGRAVGVALYDANGNLDPLFGNNGTAITWFGGIQSFAHAVSFTMDGSILLAGQATGKNALPLPAIGELYPDGSVNPAFGKGGRLIIQPGAGGGVFKGLVLRQTPTGSLPEQAIPVGWFEAPNWLSDVFLLSCIT